MMRIYKSQFDKVRPLFDFDFPNRTMLLAFLQGQTMGMAFVDNVRIPRVCIVVIEFQSWTFIGGTPQQEWINKLFDELRTDISLGLIWADWTGLDILPPPNVYKAIPRYEFLDLSVSSQQLEYSASLPEGYYFKNMDKELMTACLFGKVISEAYGSIENFLKHGFGICLMSENKICCEVYASFKTVDRYEIGVATHEAYRNRGYGYMTCAHLISRCEKGGYQTTWSCDQDNFASASIARKFTFAKQREYTLLYFSKNTKCNEVFEGADIF